jgi:nicotinamidase-related amidase
MHGLGDGQRAALVISECQNGMTNPRYASNRGLAAEAAERGVIERIRALAEDCRSAGVPVVHCTFVPRADFAGTTANCLLLASLRKRAVIREGRPEAEIHPALTPQAGDFVIQRQHGLSAFHGTELEAVLRGLGTETVILAGVSTNIAIPGTSLEAVNRGFTVVIPEDCTAGAWPEAHEFQVKHTLPLLATVTTSEAVCSVLGVPAAASDA